MPTNPLFFFFCLILGTTTASYGQSGKKWGSWNLVTVVLPAGENKWGGYAEAQVRTNGVLSQFNYFELKGGVSYDLNKNFSLLMGGGRYVTYNYLDLDAGPAVTENRMWEQVSIGQYLDRLKFEHRYRVEQRWLSTGFKNRIRYRMNLMVPINKPKIESGTFFISLYDEIFLNPKKPHFERNRLSAGIGYQFDKSIIIQAGWVDQYNYTTVSANDKNYLLLSFLYRINRNANEKHERLPSHMD
ncbi:MAG: DUF2490 domain-containing protein [Sphingobacteriaceae bacterium]